MDLAFVTAATLATIGFGALASVSDFKDTRRFSRTLAVTALLGLIAAGVLGFINAQLASWTSARATVQDQYLLNRFIWRESNRVTPASLRLVVTSTFIGGQNTDVVKPTAILAGWKADVRVTPRSQHVDSRLWTPGPLLAAAPVMVSSGAKHSVVSNYPQSRAGEWRVVTIFDDFVGEYATAAHQPEWWNEAVCEVHLSTQYAGDLENAVTRALRREKPSLPTLIESAGEAADGGLLSFYSFDNELRSDLQLFLNREDSRARPIPAILTAELHVGSRRIFREIGMPIERTYRFGVVADAHVKYYPRRVGRHFVFPDPPSHAVSAKDRTFVVLRWICFVAIVVLANAALFFWWRRRRLATA